MRVLLIAIMLIAGCGQQDNTPHGWNAILWEGYASQDAALTEQVASVQACMKEYGYAREGDPYFVIVDTLFWCNENNPNTYGCIYADILFVSIDTQVQSPIYTHDLIPLYSLAVNHEIVHWITGKLDADHKTDYLHKCSSI